MAAEDNDKTKTAEDLEAKRVRIKAMIMSGKSDPTVVKSVTSFYQDKRLVRVVELKSGEKMRF